MTILLRPIGIARLIQAGASPTGYNSPSVIFHDTKRVKAGSSGTAKSQEFSQFPRVETHFGDNHEKCYSNATLAESCPVCKRQCPTCGVDSIIRCYMRELLLPATSVSDGQLERRGTL